MATRRYGRAYNSPIGPSYTETGSGAIAFGKLVQLDSAGYVEYSTGTGTPKPMGIAIPNEVTANVNGSDAYADEDVVTVEGLVPGGIYYLFGNETITVNNFVVAGATGGVALEAAPSTKTVYAIGQAMETGSGWMKIQAI